MLAVALNREVRSSARRATVLSFESMASRGLYGAAVIPLGFALDTLALSSVLYGLAGITLASAAVGIAVGRVAGGAAAPGKRQGDPS